LLEIVEWLLKILLAFYIIKGLLGKFVEGDFTKAIIIGATFLALAFFKSFVVNS
jgi:hypothetical protein